VGNRILLITNYWCPYNASGTFRWLNFAEYIPMDVLTSKKPRRGFYDETVFKSGGRIYRIFSNLPAVLSGFILSISSIFIKYDCYVYTSPPESLLIGAWINQLLGRKVVVDMRDSIDRGALGFKPLKWLYKILYFRIKNVVAPWAFINENAIENGYDNIKRNFNALKTAEYYKGKVDRRSYMLLLSYGFVQDYSGKPKGYGASSLASIKYLGYEVNQKLHSECEEFIPNSWKVQAGKMRRYLDEIN